MNYNDYWNLVASIFVGRIENMPEDGENVLVLPLWLSAQKFKYWICCQIEIWNSIQRAVNYAAIW